MRWTSWLEALVAFHARQREVDALARLDDRLLRDIGLRRDQLDSLRIEPLALPAGAPAARAFAPLGGRPALKGCG
jgi:uncharacterized protein YjiS (DUF1127 family)